LRRVLALIILKVNLFANPPTGVKLNGPAETTQGLQEPLYRLPREWRGGEKYARVGVIGKGAFATVHKVTSKYDGSPYAAKELDKRMFMKNGVLDQKVENEMKIMQRVQHVSKLSSYLALVSDFFVGQYRSIHRAF
jgi:serine/threonine protein kinase